MKPPAPTPKEVPHLVIVAGFGESSNNHRFTELLAPVMRPRSVEVIETAPLSYPCKSPEKSIAETRRAIRENTVLVGDCAGALIALVAACRHDFKDIRKLFSVYGPLNPNIDVPPLYPFAIPFLRQYRRRVALAAEAAASLQEEWLKRIVTFGNLRDRAIPPEAKRLPGDFQEVEILETDDRFPLEPLDQDRGIHITLPFKGHLLRPSVVPERMRLIGRVMEEILKVGQR